MPEQPYLFGDARINGLTYHDEVMQLREREFADLVARLTSTLRDQLRDHAAVAGVAIDEFAARWIEVGNSNEPLLINERETRDERVWRWANVLGWAFSEGFKAGQLRERAALSVR